MTLEQMISDTLAVTNYLRNRFGQEKITLMGHSGGTFIGIQVAARAPEDQALHRRGPDVVSAQIRKTGV